MATSTRLKGKQGLVLTGKVGSAAVVDISEDVKSWELSYEKKDDGDLTFAEAAAGTGYDATLKLTAISSNDATSLRTFLEANVGADVVLKLGPYGNAAASATKPHYTGTARIELPPNISNEARTSEEGSEFEVELKYSTVLTKATS